MTGNKIYDSAGEEFIIRGFNHTFYWGDPIRNFNAVNSFDQTGANCVRLVFTRDPTHTWSSSDTWAKRKEAIDAVLAKNLVPVVEFHNATGSEDPADLSSIVDTWVNDAPHLEPYEGRIIVNIANEWGPHSATRSYNGTSASDVWANNYATAIQRIRNAGIDSLIMVDSGMWAQDPRFIRNRGAQVLDSDPHKNVVFSLHFYKQWYNPGSITTNYDEELAKFDVRVELNHIKNTLNLPVVVGEFTWEGANDVQAIDGSGNTYSTRTVMQTMQDLGVGWLAWSWNQNFDPKLDMLKPDKHLYAPGDLTPFGDLVINDAELGMKATARKPAGFAEVPEPTTLAVVGLASCVLLQRPTRASGHRSGARRSPRAIWSAFCQS